jgi:ribosomal protein S18 acetylase RimI-like enzyme
MFGYDGHRGWLYYFAVLPEYQNKGYGRALLAHGEAALTAMGCSKINLQIRDTTTNTTGITDTVTAFYEKSGYRADAVLSYGKRLIDDE